MREVVAADMGIGADYGSVSKTKSNQMDSWLWWKAAQSTALKPPSKVLRLQDQARFDHAGRASSGHTNQRTMRGVPWSRNCPRYGRNGQFRASSCWQCNLENANELLTDLGGAVQPMEDDVMAIIDFTSLLLRFLPHTTSCQWCGFRFNILWGV